MKVIADVTRAQFIQVVFLLIFGLPAASLMAYAATVPAATADAGSDEKYTCPGIFSVVVPREWEKVEKGHPYGDLTKITGVRLFGDVIEKIYADDETPIYGGGGRPTLAVLYYSGEHILKTPDEFIRNKLDFSMVRTDSDRQVVIGDIQIAGRAGKKFHINTYELVNLPQQERPSMREGIVYEIMPKQKKVNMIEQYIVVPARQGYFVLGYRAPEKKVNDYQGLFEKIVNSFQPHLP